MKIKYSPFSLVAAALYFAVFFNLSYIPSYNLLRDGFIAFIALYIFLNIKSIIKSGFSRILFFVFLFIILIVVAMVNRYSASKSHLNDFIIFCASLAEIYLMMESKKTLMHLDQVLVVFFKIHLVLIVINDIMVLFASKDTLIKTEAYYYFIGDKFTVGYAHIILLGLYMTYLHIKNIRIKKRLWVIIPMIAGSVYIDIQVDCMTSAFGIILYLVIVLLLTKNSLLFSGKAIFLVLVISTLFAFTYETVLSIPAVQVFITDFLGRSLTLTSRTLIFQILPELMNGYYLWGYGYKTSYDVMMPLFYYPNTQNGILEWVWNSGIISTAAMMILIYESVRMVDAADKGKVKYLLSVLYVMCFFSSIEIVINILFFVILALVYAISKQSGLYPDTKKLCK